MDPIRTGERTRPGPGRTEHPPGRGRNVGGGEPATDQQS